MAMGSDAEHVRVKVPRRAVVTVIVESVDKDTVDEICADEGDTVTLAEASGDGPKVKTGFYQAPVEAARMRAAFLATQSLEHNRSLSAFISTAVRREVERLEMRYNDGRSWPPVETGEIPAGAPIRD
jgi:hypothetical protein